MREGWGVTEDVPACGWKPICLRHRQAQRRGHADRTALSTWSQLLEPVLGRCPHCLTQVRGFGLMSEEIPDTASLDSTGRFQEQLLESLAKYRGHLLPGVISSWSGRRPEGGLLKGYFRAGQPLDSIFLETKLWWHCPLFVGSGGYDNSWQVGLGKGTQKMYPSCLVVSSSCSDRWAQQSQAWTSEGAPLHWGSWPGVCWPSPPKTTSDDTNERVSST